MKTLYEFITFLKYGSIFLAIGTAFMTYNAYRDEVEDIEKINYGLDTSKMGFLRIKSRIGGGMRVRTINAYGYIERVDSSNIDSRRVIMGIGEVYSKDFDNKFEGDLIPIWYDVSKDFVYARVFKTSKETIFKLLDAAERSKKLYLKINLFLIFLPFLFYLFQKLIAKFLP
jgi:hypothetical protein